MGPWKPFSHKRTRRTAILFALLVAIGLGWGLREAFRLRPPDLVRYGPFLVPRTALLSGNPWDTLAPVRPTHGWFRLWESTAFAEVGERRVFPFLRADITGTETITTVAGSGATGPGGGAYTGDGGPATSARLNVPEGVAVDSSGNIYIADRNNHAIRKVSGGTITTVAGTGTAGFSGDGALATSAQLNLPTGVAVDASGNLFIVDHQNSRIRKVTAGTITTVAGGGTGGLGDGGAATSAGMRKGTW